MSQANCLYMKIEICHGTICHVKVAHYAKILQIPHCKEEGVLDPYMKPWLIILSLKMDTHGETTKASPLSIFLLMKHLSF